MTVSWCQGEAIVTRAVFSCWPRGGPCMHTEQYMVFFQALLQNYSLQEFAGTCTRCPRRAEGCTTGGKWRVHVVLRTEQGNGCCLWHFSEAKCLKAVSCVTLFTAWTRTLQLQNCTGNTVHAIPQHSDAGLSKSMSTEQFAKNRKIGSAAWNCGWRFLKMRSIMISALVAIELLKLHFLTSNV